MAVPGGKVEIAQYSAGAQPADAPHCRITGKLNDRVGVDGKRYAIGFELRLPKIWNQRFYFQGGGGTDGVLRPAVGAAPAGGVLPNALANGFAVASTDAGHLNEPGAQGSFFFGLDPQARVDYGYNHLPVVSVAAKALIQKLYGTEPKTSYFVGCSNGGRQGMMAAQRFPDLFDGVISGAPAYRVVEASLDAAAQTQQFASVAPKGTDGRPNLGKAYSMAELAVVAKGILQSCDALDGIADGMVNSIRSCKFDPTSVQCSTGQSANCLAPEKAAALKAAFSGARNPRGKLIYSQWPFDPGIATPLWTSWKLGPEDAMPPRALNTTLVAGALSHVFVTPPQPTADLYDFVLKVDPVAALAQTKNSTASFTETGRHIVNADSPNLDAFTRRGGKIIFYHGMADGIFSPTDTVNYREQLRQRYGRKAENFTRLYLVPGMGHCGGGPATDQFDALSALVAWVEDGKAPHSLTARTGANSQWPNRSRPLCDYPKQAVYDGKGDSENAASFVCR
ncbi:MAG TPA: tannase/feruloyl esterase family alpha/beta hydrolase [Steroidobacteraceae bacterium]|nr:tannase/feruloyl esterase family alpha/beta hydrolase [Steroidobacteraceae bacterium]